MKGKKVALKVMVAAVAVVMVLAVVPSEAVAYSYNRPGAVNYALGHWNSDVPGSWWFSSNGGDCTNFVSWCLYFGGGWPMRWPGYEKNYEWYCSNIFWHSNSWTCVKEFGDFAQYRGYKIYLGDNTNTVKSRISWLIDRGELQKGDVIQRIPSPDRQGHTMIVTEIIGNTVKVAHHSPNKHWSFNDFLNNPNYNKPGDKFVAFHLYDGYLSADLNCDGNVNLADHAILMSFWEKDPSGADSCQSPDINQDGKVNLVDHSIMMSQWTE